jgi:DNA primase
VAAVLRQLGIVADEVFPGVGAEDKPEEAEIKLPEDFTPLVRVYDDLDRTARAYVLKRGVTPEQIKKHKIGVSYTGRYAYRVLFPIKAEGRLVGINARDFTGQQEPKYLLSRGEKYIYNLDPKAKTLVLSEGTIKALKIEQVTDASSGALLGHSLTDRQLGQIRASACRHVTLYPDAERIGRRGFLNIACRLKEEWDGNVSIVHPVRTPADDAPLDEIRDNLRNHAHAWSSHIDVRMAE